MGFSYTNIQKLSFYTDIILWYSVSAKGGIIMDVKVLKEIDVLKDSMFKAVFRSEEAREMVSVCLSKLTGIDVKQIRNAEYQGGELSKKIMSEKGKNSDLIIKIKNDNRIILEMNRQHTKHLFEKNTSYAFSIASEMIKSGSEEYPNVILINFDNFNTFRTQRGILNFKLRDEEGHIETEQYHSIHLVLENILDERYNIDETIKKLAKFLKCKTIEEMKEEFKGDEMYMAAVRKVEDLSTDPNFVGYYDIEEAHRQDIADARETGYDEGMEAGLEEGKNIGIEEGKKQNQIEIVKSMYKEEISIDTIAKCTGLTAQEIEQIVTG